MRPRECARKGGDQDVPDRLAVYRAYLETQPLAAAMRRTYAGSVAALSLARHAEVPLQY